MLNAKKLIHHLSFIIHNFLIKTMIEQHQFCTFFLNDFFFGIDVRHVQEVIRYQEMTCVPLAPPNICGLINLRGQIVTTIDLRCRLEMGEFSVKSISELEPEQLPYNVVIRTDNEVVSLLVDDIGDILEFTPGNFEPPPATLQGKLRQVLQGAYKLKDGFLLILDTEKVLEIKRAR